MGVEANWLERQIEQAKQQQDQLPSDFRGAIDQATRLASSMVNEVGFRSEPEQLIH